MIDLLERAAAVAPDRNAVLTHEVAVTYAALLTRSRAVAGALLEHGITRFAVADVDADVVLPMLAGAALAGAEACLYPPTDADDIHALTTRFDHAVVVSDRTDLVTSARVVPPGDWMTAAPTLISPPSSRPHLVLTTGTTGTPRGVRHDWGRLVRGVSRVERAGDDQRWLLAYGLHQFAGLQLVLHVLAAAATLVAPAPRRPQEGLAAMRSLAVTHVSATPTYWRFLLAELRADGGPRPRLRQVTLGGEAIPGPLLQQVRAAFPDAAVSQIYAASEFGSSGSVRDGRAGLSVDVLDRGEEADVDMRVVAGELWVRSRFGMLGYHGESPVDPDGWRATGDLVEVVGDRVEFRGRSTEIINVGGVKVHPLPIEERVSAVAGVDVARVWGRPNALTGSIVAVEVAIAPDADQESVRRDIRSACADLPAAARPRSITFASEIATRGNKILRRDDT